MSATTKIDFVNKPKCMLKSESRSHTVSTYYLIPGKNVKIRIQNVIQQQLPINGYNLLNFSLKVKIKIQQSEVQYLVTIAIELK